MVASFSTKADLAIKLFKFITQTAMKSQWFLEVGGPHGTASSDLWPEPYRARLGLAEAEDGWSNTQSDLQNWM